MTVRFDRSLDERFIRRLQGELSWLLQACREQRDPWALDPQFREKAGKRAAGLRPGGNTLAIYHGTTKLLTAKWEPGNGRETVTLSAEGRHCANSTGDLLGHHGIEEAASLGPAARRYLAAAIAAEQDDHFSPSHEGYWQNILTWHFGAAWAADKDMLVLDREAVLGFDSEAEKVSWYASTKDVYTRLARESRGSVPDKFQEPSSFGDEVDLLAIDRHGRLLCVELKHRTNASGVYWAPLQVLVYRDAYRKASAELHAGITKLVRQKIELGLLPSEAASVLPARPWTPNDVQAVVAVAQPGRESGGWDAWAALRPVQRALPEPVPVMLVDGPAGKVEVTWHADWPLLPSRQEVRCGHAEG